MNKCAQAMIICHAYTCQCTTHLVNLEDKYVNGHGSGIAVIFVWTVKLSKCDRNAAEKSFHICFVVQSEQSITN